MAAVIAALVVGPAAAAPARAPDLSGNTLTGRKLDLGWYRGKWVVLNVWASW